MYFCSKYKNWEHMTTSIDIARRIAEVNHPLSRESVHALAEILVCRKYRKGEIVLQAGEVCKAMLFIEKGMLRQFYYKYDKEERKNYFKDFVSEELPIDSLYMTTRYSDLSEGAQKNKGFEGNKALLKLDVK